MNSKERLIAALHGQPLDYTPFSPFLAYVWDSFSPEIQKAGKLAFHQAIGADPLWRGAPCAVKPVMPEQLETKNFKQDGRNVTQFITPVGTIQMAYGNSSTGNTAFLLEHPLKSEEDWKIQLWIEENTTMVYDPSLADQHFQQDGQEGLSLGMLVPKQKSAYQFMVEHLAGTEALIYAGVDFPDTVNSLWEAMVQNNLAALKLSLQSEYDYFITWEDSSTQNYSPDQYDQFIGTEIGNWCKILDASGKKYVQHACGHIEVLVERMKNHGVFAVESVSPPPTGNIEVKDVRSKLGDQMGIIGGIEPTKFLNYSVEELVPYAESVIVDAKGGPFVLANADSCPPGVTMEKFKVVAETAKNFKI